MSSKSIDGQRIIQIEGKSRFIYLFEMYNIQDAISSIEEGIYIFSNKAEFPDIKGPSGTNLFYAKQFYNFYQPAIVQQPVGQLGQLAVDELTVPASLAQQSGNNYQS